MKDTLMNRLTPYKIPNLKIYKNGKQKLVKVKTIKWFDKPMRTIIVTQYGEYQPIKYVPFNPGSRAHIVRWMEEDYGYSFPFYTPTGGAKVDPDSLTNMEHPAGKLLKRYLKVVKDQSQIGGDGGSILKAYRKDLHGVTSNIDTNGTVTGRFTSSNINLAQVPAQEEFRELFRTPTYYNIDDNLYEKLKEYNEIN